MSKQGRLIRGEMARRGIVGADIARRLGITRQQVSQVILGKRTSKRVVDALIAAGIPERLFRGL